MSEKTSSDAADVSSWAQQHGAEPQVAGGRPRQLFDVIAHQAAEQLQVRLAGLAVLH